MCRCALKSICLIVNHYNVLWTVIVKHLHVSRSLMSCFSAAGLLLWIGCLLPVLRLLSQDQTVHLHTLHVRPLLHVGHGDLCHHDVPHCGDSNARKCEFVQNFSVCIFQYQVPWFTKTIKSGLRSAAPCYITCCWASAFLQNEIQLKSNKYSFSTLSYCLCCWGKHMQNTSRPTDVNDY